ncbi:hypothetical protein [Caballeronia sp. AZ10_KS36]|uniref:hypothetical protein n=1 Tax=Caballeronia sp. AZ10_KS36 TaxID=2921757 RepID=UPI002028D0FD|nr:hypothetical protein [Caballeronia sp. AZ10_KS36]
MQSYLHVNRRMRRVACAQRDRFAAAWLVLLAAMLSGCGGGESAPAPVAVSQQETTAPSRLQPQKASPIWQGSMSPKAADEAAVPPAWSPAMMQLNALPQLSSLSEREKAGLLMLLSSKSSPERLALINMYPGLAHLTEQQKDLLLAKLENIVPVKGSH